jgi:hypothetical protein
MYSTTGASASWALIRSIAVMFNALQINHLVSRRVAARSGSESQHRPLFGGAHAPTSGLFRLLYDNSRDAVPGCVE